MSLIGDRALGRRGRRSPENMTDAEIEIAIRRAGHDLRWEVAANGGVRAVYALRDGRRHTRSHATFLALARYLGRVERPVQFVEDRGALRDDRISERAQGTCLPKWSPRSQW